jgi:hypothetical protein
MGWGFMITRYLIDICVIIAIAIIMDKLITIREKKLIYEKANR